MASLEERVKKDPKLLARVLKNPGLRSKLPTSMLSGKQQRQRKANVRLNQPIVQGSSTTERELAREAKAAMDVKYGGVEREDAKALGQEQTRARDTTGFYDQYLAQVAKHSQNIQAINAAAATTGAALQQGVTGLSQAGIQGIQNPAVADASARGAQAGDLSGMASNAAAIRQALVGSFVNQTNNEGKATAGYADTLANVVAPGQKLGAQAMAQGRVRDAEEDVTTTAEKRGADDSLYRSERRTEEGKNILAQQIAGVNATDKELDNKRADKQIKETKRANQARETETATARRERLDAAAVDKATKAKEPNKYGVPADQWAKWSTSHRQREIDKWEAKDKTKEDKPLAPDKQYEQDFYGKYGVKPVASTEVTKAREVSLPQIKQRINDMTKKRADGKALTVDEVGRILTKGQPAGSILITKDNKDRYPGWKVGDKKPTPPIPAYPAVLIRVVMDQLSSNGTISAATANRLHKAGYSVEQLGLNTGSAPASPKPKPPLNTGGDLGGFPK